MSSRLDRGGRGGRKFFISSHRCPEVDLLPHHDSETQVPPPCSLVPVVKSPEFTCTGQSEANYLNVSSTCRSEEEEEEEGNISDWSEEDLSLHFSPSVILPSDDEESDPDSSFECVNVTVETLVNGQKGEGLKMVPKRLIQLKKKDAANINQEKTEKLQVILKDGPAEGRVANSEGSVNELLGPIVCHRPDLLLRQHSMPASLHTRSTTSGDVDSYRVYRGLVAGAIQGVHDGGSSRQRLQKSFSLDETKTKMASCIIKSVLSKKMQVEQNTCKTSDPQKIPAVAPGPLQPADQQRVRDGGGGKTGGSVFKAPVHVVRDMRSLVKNTYSLSFATPENKPTSFKVIGQEESPPPTYQQAVGVKGHNDTKRSFSSRRITEGTETLSQSQDRKQSNRLNRPITQQRRSSEPTINRSKEDEVTPPTNSPVTSDLSVLSHSERAPPSTSRRPQGPKPLLSAQEQSSVLGVSSQFVPSSCLYTPTALPAFPSTQHPHLGSYVHSPLSYIQTQLQPPPPAPNLHLLRRSEENQCGSTGNTSNQPDQSIKTCPPDRTRTRTRTTEDQERNSVTPATQEQREQHEQQKHQQQHFLCNLQGFLPAQVSGDFLVDIAGSAAAPGALLSGPAPCHLMLDPIGGRCFQVDMPPQPQRKILLDPETGQYVQVFLPVASPALRCVNPTPFAPSVINTAPAVLSVMQFQPTVAVSPLYAPPCLPFALHRPSVNFTRTAP